MQDIADYLKAEAERLERHDVLKFLAEKAREGAFRGDACMMQSGGEGGFGDLMERDAELVAEDVLRGLFQRQCCAQRLRGRAQGHWRS